MTFDFAVTIKISRVTVHCCSKLINIIHAQIYYMSRNLLQFKSRWLLAHDPRHFTIGTVFFDIFTKYKYLHLFSARRFTMSDIIQK